MSSLIAIALTKGTDAQRFRRSIPRTALTAAGLIFSDALAIVSGYFLFRHGRPMPAILLPVATGRPDLASATDIYLLAGAFFVVIRGILGDYSRRQLFWDGARATSSTLPLIAIPDILFVAILGNSHLYPALILSWLFLFPAIPAYRHLARYLMSVIGLWQIPTAILGNGPRAEEAFAGLSDSLSLGFDVCWIVPHEIGKTMPKSLSALKSIVSTNFDDVVHQLSAVGCRRVVIADEDFQPLIHKDRVQRLIESGVAVAIVPSLYRLPLINVSTSYFFGGDMLLLQVQNNTQRLSHRLVKRIFDIVGSAALLIVASPFFLAIALVIWFGDRGSVFYGQKRIGFRGKQFKCLKFRTMSMDAEERLRRWRVENPELYAEFQKSFKIQNDPRIIPIGNWLRSTSLDELPQLINVLFGNMSLVGPRPMLLDEPPIYGDSFRLYTTVRPGITGVWQVLGRNDVPYEQRAVYNDWYILNQSFWLDIVTLFRTLYVVLARVGAS